MSISSTATTIPAGIDTFFESLYGVKPNVSEDRKNTVYSLQGKPISIITDKFGGCHVNFLEVSYDQPHVTQAAISQLSETLKTSKVFDSIWVDFPLPVNPFVMGSFLPASFMIGEPDLGDLIYDTQQNKIRVWQWLNEEKKCAIPPGATHNIGATALLIDLEARKVLLVVNVMRSDSWNLPGGSFDIAKDRSACDTSLREAQEEGGFVLPKITSSKLVGQSQFLNNQFAPAISQTWAHFCNGMSKISLNPPKGEIIKAEWLPIDEILATNGTYQGLKVSAEITATLRAAVEGLGFDLVSVSRGMVVHAPVPSSHTSLATPGCIK